MPLSPGNSFVIELQDLKNPVTGLFVDDATVTAVVTDSDGVNVAGVWPVTLDFVVGSNGLYRATIDPIVGLIIGNTYITKINAVGTDLLELELEQKNRATKRVSCA